MTTRGSLYLQVLTLLVVTTLAFKLVPSGAIKCGFYKMSQLEQDVRRLKQSVVVSSQPIPLIAQTSHPNICSANRCEVTDPLSWKHKPTQQPEISLHACLHDSSKTRQQIKLISKEGSQISIRQPNTAQWLVFPASSLLQIDIFREQGNPYIHPILCPGSQIDSCMSQLLQQGPYIPLYRRFETLSLDFNPSKYLVMLVQCIQQYKLLINLTHKNNTIINIEQHQIKWFRRNINIQDAVPACKTITKNQVQSLTEVQCYGTALDKVLGFYIMADNRILSIHMKKPVAIYQGNPPTLLAGTASLLKPSLRAIQFQISTASWITIYPHSISSFYIQCHHLNFTLSLTNIHDIVSLQILSSNQSCSVHSSSLTTYSGVIRVEQQITEIFAETFYPGYATNKYPKQYLVRGNNKRWLQITKCTPARLKLIIVSTEQETILQQSYIDSSTQYLILNHSNDILIQIFSDTYTYFSLMLFHNDPKLLGSSERPANQTLQFQDENYNEQLQGILFNISIAAGINYSVWGSDNLDSLHRQLRCPVFNFLQWSGLQLSKDAITKLNVSIITNKITRITGIAKTKYMAVVQVNKRNTKIHFIDFSLTAQTKHAKRITIAALVGVLSVLMVILHTYRS